MRTEEEMRMTDPTPDSTGDARVRHESRPSVPLWVKLFGIVALVALVLIVGVMLLAGGEHGPGRHTMSGDAGSQTPATAAGRVGEPTDADEATRTVEVTTLDTMAFQPDTIDVSAGEAVTFVVTNTGRAVHEFTLGDAAMQQEHADAMAHMPAWPMTYRTASRPSRARPAS